MNEPESAECDSVDLTEDEDSSEENSGIESPFHFVSCSDILKESTTSQLLPMTAVASSSSTKNRTTPKNVLKSQIISIVGGPSGPQIALNKKVAQFTSVQLKPPVNLEKKLPVGNTLQEIETVSLDDDDDPAVYVPKPVPVRHNPRILKKPSGISVPQNDVTYSLKQPPGKVVIIKKNNKYYKIIIPHNVMPNINQSMGPVLINIPEVGPLVISNDPQAALSKPSLLQPQQLSLNLDAVHQNQIRTPPVKPPRDPKEVALCDKKFCWTYVTRRKRDLEGFSAYDRLGFNKSETGKARRCERVLNSILAKYQTRLHNLSQEYDRFKKSQLKMNKVKLVKINTIIQASKQIKENKIHTGPILSKLNPPPPKKSKTSLRIGKTVCDTVEIDDYGSDLLVTKKVVILDQENKAVEIKRTSNEILRKRTIADAPKPERRGRPKKRGRHERNFKIKPCVVELVRQKAVEKAYLKYCKQMNLQAKRKGEIRLKSKEKLFGPQANKFQDNNVKSSPVPSKSSAMSSKSSSTPSESSLMSSIKNHSLSKQTKEFRDTNVLLTTTIIKSEQHFKVEINNHKPILILTEQTIGTNRTIEYYCKEFVRFNIIYIVNASKTFPHSIITDQGFASAVEIGYIKLVDPKIFCKFVANGLRFSGTEGRVHSGEHNYSLPKS